MITRIAIALGVLLTGAPAARALAAAEPTTAAEAQVMALHYRDQAQRYRALGGPAYKTGMLQRAEADAARYDALAAELAAPAAYPLPRSPEAEHYAELAQRYRTLGGPAYKTGSVQRAEAEEAKYEEASEPPAPPPPGYRPACNWATKPVVRTVGCLH
jgi:hypothetical protein